MVLQQAWKAGTAGILMAASFAATGWAQVPG